MFEQLIPHSEQQFEISRVIQDRTTTRDDYPNLPAYIWEISQVAASTLLQWRIPLSTAMAAFIFPLLVYDTTTPQALAATYGQEPIRLAKQLIDLPFRSMPLESEAEPSLTQNSMKLRRLFRLAYLDLNFVLLTMAFHDAILICLDLPESLIRGLISETTHVFIPLAEMLGLWNLRRRWLNRLADLLRSEKPGNENYIRVWAGLQKTKQDRDNAFTVLQDYLAGKLGTSEIRQREAHVGENLWRIREGQTIDEVTSQLTVEILCDSAEDCYPILGLVHNLGKPVAPRFSERFDDYIASPQPNGYRALHTAIIYNYEKERTKGVKTILVEFRILTHEMHKLNMGGVITALYLNKGEFDNITAWWNNKQQLSKQLENRYRLGYNISDFISKYELDSQPHPANPEVCEREACPILTYEKLPAHPIYVFTPRGEIHLLPEGASALDFAFNLHSEIGHHARRICVNSQSTPFDYPLRNGDIVNVDFDRYFSGLDFSWRDLAKTSSASQRIRQGLAAQAVRIHEGRHEIVHTLMNVLRFLENSKHFSLQVTTNRLDNFLIQSALAKKLPTVQALYSKVANGQVSPHKIVHKFISQEIAAYIVDRQGRSIASSYPPHRISLCETCFPVPGESIVGRTRRFSAASVGLTVHKAVNNKCRGIPLSEDSVFLRWIEPSPEQDLSVELVVTGTDRRGLLDDILNIVYDQDGVYIFRVNAWVHSGDCADIVIRFMAENWNQLTRLKTHAELVPNVHSVNMSPVSQPLQLALVSPQIQNTDRIRNPYTLHEVYDRLMFYDRDAEKEAILRWLDSPPPTPWLILHGQRRVGKTSLAMHLKSYLSDRGVKPIFVDFQALDLATPKEIADLIVRTVYNTLLEPFPSPGADESPAGFMNRALEEIVIKLKGYKLLIMIDEFNALLKREEEGKLDPIVFPNLRSVLSQRRDVYFLLIVQDSHLHDRTRWGGAGDLFGQAAEISLPPLDPQWVKKLITEPLSRCGCYYEEEIVAKIAALTGGIPFYTHILCGELIELLNRQNRRRILVNDLNQVVSSILSRGARYFNHFIESLHGLRKIVLTMIALHEEGGWVPLSDIVVDLRDRGANVHTSALNNTIRDLMLLGMLDSQDDQGAMNVRIRTDLFQMWVRQNFDPESIAEDIVSLRRSLKE